MAKMKAQWSGLRRSLVLQVSDEEICAGQLRWVESATVAL